MWVSSKISWFHSVGMFIFNFWQKHKLISNIFDRYMMYIKGRHEIYLIDRDNAVFEAPQLTFPQRKSPHAHVEDTLLDGVSSTSSTRPALLPGVRPAGFARLLLRKSTSIVRNNALCSRRFTITTCCSSSTQLANIFCWSIWKNLAILLSEGWVKAVFHLTEVFLRSGLPHCRFAICYSYAL